jgi:hypothetical protein
MKKTIITILAVSAGIFAISACQKNLSDVQTSQVITKTVTVSETPWTADTKTAFTEADGIKVTGKENMAVFYYAGDKTTTVSGVAQTYATPDGNGGYTFSHDAADGSTYNYWFVLPNTSRVTLNKAANDHTFWLHPTQFPAEDSFDSNMDALVGQAQYGVAAKTSVTDVKFRRLFSHLELKLSDGKGVIGDEKIHAVTFALGTTATTSSALTGIVYPGSAHSDVYNDVANVMETPGNAVTAHYPAGLSKNSDGTYHIWYVVNPVAVAANTEITVTVTADTKTVTRTVALSEAKEIMKGKINRIEFDITGAGYTTQESAYYNFSVASLDNLPSSWAVNTSAAIFEDEEGSTYQNALKMTAKKATLEYKSPDSKAIAGVNLYISPKSPNDKTGLTVTLNGTTEAKTWNVNYAVGADPSTVGGYKCFYGGMKTSSGAVATWPESTTSIKFTAKNSSSFNYSALLVDAVVLFGTATAGE